MNKRRFYISIFKIIIMFSILFIGCKTDVDPTYTVWVSTENYTDYQSAFGALNDGAYRRIEVFEGEINYSVLPNEAKRNWTENDIYNWLYGRDFISSEAKEVAAWIVSTKHCIIASRSGVIVYMLIK